MAPTAKDRMARAALLGSAPVLRRVVRRTIEMRRSQLELLPLPAGCLLFLGDSITEQGMWHEWLPEHAVLNRGVGGDTVSGVHARLDSAVNAPATISLLVGTNDLGGLGETRDAAEIARRFRLLVEELVRRAPDAHLIVNSVMPRHRSLADEVRALNVEYRTIAADVGASYLDLWPALADAEAQLRRDLTGDSLHLNGPGYSVWLEQLRPLIGGSTHE